MKHFQDKRQVMSKIYSRFTVYVLVVIIILLGNGVYNIYLRERESDRMRLEAEKRLQSLNEQRSNLIYEMDKLQSDSGVEEKIRNKFNFVRPGEHIVVIVPPDEPTSTKATSTGFFASLWKKMWP